MPGEPSKLGDPARVSVTRIVRPTYRVQWEYDGTVNYVTIDGDDYAACRKRQVRTFLSRVAAYRWAARKLIFARRDQFAERTEATHYAERGACELCAAEERRLGRRPPDEAPPMCRYHDSDSFLRLTDRLARWLMWRDRQAKGLLEKMEKTDAG